MFAITKKITTHFSIIIQRYIQYYIMYGLTHECSEQNTKLYIIYIMRLLNILFWADFRRSSTNNHTPNKLFIFNDALFLCIIFPASDTKNTRFARFLFFTV